ncbi:hypothetical protein CEY04_01490 [Achromobacter sp. HZ28]|nr:hypothetical protein CEY05_01490 [Achromobacter sp. HZ34]OWT82012.1 hypothetical protein CEY04_01490 [Achromobacter sp. HZ28]
MHVNRRAVLGLMAAAALPGRWALASSARTDDGVIEQAYLYLLGRMLVLRQEHIDRAKPSFAYNQINYNPLGSADFVNPNFDVAYLEAWIAVDDRTPVLLTVPRITGRYYTAQILDEWGEVIANINERTFASQPSGSYALVAPGWRDDLPAGVARIELHSRKAKLLGRVELKDDPDGAIKLQQAFALGALGRPVVFPAPVVPSFNNQDLLGAEIFDDVDARIDSAFDVSPVAAQMQQQVRAVAEYVASSAQARAAVDKLLREQVVPRFIEYAFTKSAPYRNHWVGGGATGNYGSDYLLRTVVNYAGIWANTSGEAVYFGATRDANEAPLNGSNSYVMHFPADQLPQSAVDAYWSVILVSVPDYRVVPNDLKRYNFNNHSNLKLEADGSMKIVIGPKAVAGVAESNWLPAPPGKPFSLTFRMYVPKDAVKTGAWAPPAVTPL